jgi:hypothetical protein
VFRGLQLRIDAQNTALSAPNPHPDFSIFLRSPEPNFLLQTLDREVYGHLEPGANRQAVNKLPSLDDSKPIELHLKSQQ